VCRSRRESEYLRKRQDLKKAVQLPAKLRTRGDTVKRVSYAWEKPESSVCQKWERVHWWTSREAEGFSCGTLIPEVD
jgi:hypothetical protein